MRYKEIIECIETGARFYGGVKVAELYDVSVSAINQAIKNHTKIRGHTFRYIKQDRYDFINQTQWDDCFEDCFQKWYSGEQKIDNAMIEKLSLVYPRAKDTMFRFKKEAIAIRFRRECDKREIPHPPRSRLHETRPDIKSKYDEKTWYKAYEHWTEHKWTLEDIAEDLGVSTKTVYRHFKKIGGEKIEN